MKTTIQECKKSKKGDVSHREDDETSGVCDDESVAGLNMTHPNSP